MQNLEWNRPFKWNKYNPGSWNLCLLYSIPLEYHQASRSGSELNTMYSINNRHILSSKHHDQLIFSFLRTSCSQECVAEAIWSYQHIWEPYPNTERDFAAAMTVIEENRPFAQQLSNVYFTILSLFCFKLFVKISLAILSHFYIVKGNRKEAARIAAEFYGVPQGQGIFVLTLLSLLFGLFVVTGFFFPQVITYLLASFICSLSNDMCEWVFFCSSCCVFVLFFLTKTIWRSLVRLFKCFFFFFF